MDLKLTRIDYTQVGTTSPNTMRLLPSTGKTQKIAIADNNGVVQCFGVKKQEIIPVFKTLPSQKISRLKLGGAHETSKSNIFVACGSEVWGFSKKGKQFLLFNTNLSENIESMYVDGADLFVCGSYIFTHYQECNDINNILCGDHINDVICLPKTKQEIITPVLASRDRLLLVVQDSTIKYHIEVIGSPTVLELFENDGGSEGNEIIYGTSDGYIGHAQLERNDYSHQWEIPNLKKSGGISCLNMFDITSDGVPDVLVGRDDGLIDVYAFDEFREPVQKYSHTCTESITSIQGGVVSAANYPEIVCATYPGWVMGLTTDPSTNHGELASDSFDQFARTKILGLKQELEEIQKTVGKQREKYQHNVNTKVYMASLRSFHVNTSFVLNKDDASYQLSIELQIPIENILIQSDVPVYMIDVDKNLSVASFSACNPQDGNCLLATYRCQSNTTRIDLKVRTIEGQHGTLQAYITPRTQPKTCQIKQFQIKPLSLHTRIHSFDSARPFNSLKLKGQFSFMEAHSWGSSCLPEFPEKPPMEETAVHYFISAFQQTMLECSYSKGEILFRSENISTISILKDFITTEATKKKIHLTITCDVDNNLVPYILNIMHPKMEDQLRLARNVKILEALEELQVHEKDLSFLSEEYQKILEHAESIRNEISQSSFHLERLHNVITDLFIDSNRFKGHDVKNKLPDLKDILTNYDLCKLVKFFDTATES
ncbi:Bardet-Biedl syndrome 7 protein homolog isoform X1 [Octopus bimaculoides]|uniref:Bardet-Biedl syndrome 7 protein homolog n=1 Tax=Octopus bimaculoides TaxID=37653 RepID=A0A0L8GCJ1_OCTBM|nr:Bardet-Biedl syndrome 7 protein homolog isoform X1 [Octopus bimaculoides]|eukprot:XP_014782164.1 PREDICTED: Bardet-Biedl syndrome 7 protein homolog isoform X1 [Octopus bimaculoides]